jgi:hypothetical protein
MASIMDIFNPQVSQSGGTVTVTYCHGLYSGTCTYEETTLQGTTKKFKQRFFIMTHCDMDDVIEYLYKVGEINGPSDLQKIDHLIRDHSRTQVEGGVNPETSGQ